jgi:mannose-6-phosphate isomerase
MTLVDGEPTLLAPNVIRRFYRSGGQIGTFRRTRVGQYDSEEWVGSTTQAFGDASGLGLSRLENDQLLREVVESNPLELLGPAHVARFGPSTELLVKILDAGERLPVHVHPDREFARDRLGSPHGKAEAWIILAAPEDAQVHLGFRRPMERTELEQMMADQDRAAMLNSLHHVRVGVGDTVFVPAGLPHSIGEGILLVELQEPTDYSILIEWDGYDLAAPTGGQLGLTQGSALDSVNRAGLPADYVRALHLPRSQQTPEAFPSILPSRADKYFRAQRFHGDAQISEPSFAIFVGVSGEMTMTTEHGITRVLSAGDCMVVPYSAGACSIEGQGEFLRCTPPSP